MNGPIRVKTIDHVVLRTSRLPEMLQFYQHMLGCNIERELTELGLTQLRAGNAIIDIITVDKPLGQLGGEPPSQNGRNLDHFCLQIEYLDEAELLKYLHQHHVQTEEFTERYGAQGYGRSIYIKDPEGNIVELKPEKNQ
ncbi:VOC family protein [Vibrio sagamiensis]|uniref:Lactoylglutathione lyase n=1 Tax=Vibrio sagamiensis NBRC 104589 TaxID=1219064 RepID=A0A511QIY4_9VIBR|nr:VOC family protein [Vibrio sagamiensis]PNQ62607.1 VOC family virulence protein [Vibrio agarivorans]GEM77294.1 lactoylglutathione lyase [Vibrio sagamiensis NBRC 104589]